VLKRVRKELEAEIANEAQPLEEKLKSKFVNIVRRCQEACFLDYKKLWQVVNSSFATNDEPPNELLDDPLLETQEQLPKPSDHSTNTDNIPLMFSVPTPLISTDSDPDLQDTKRDGSQAQDASVRKPSLSNDSGIGSESISFKRSTGEPDSTISLEPYLHPDPFGCSLSEGVADFFNCDIFANEGEANGQNDSFSTEAESASPRH
jgi:hypothetical protein